MTNIEAIREYRASRDAAEGVAIANGLRDVVKGAHVRGEITSEAACEAWGYLDEIERLAGTDPKVHERKAVRQRDALMKKNDGLVWRKAKQLLGARRNNPANLEEAIQEGRIGLMRAIEVFDESRGSSFSTCAMVWIRHHVQNCMHSQVDFAKQRSACMPAGVVRQVTKFRHLYGREPEPHEVEHKGKPCTQEQWDRWLDSAHTISVEDMLTRADDDTGEKGRGSSDIIADESTNPELVLAGVHLQNVFEAEMAAISPRNREITKAIFVDGRTLQDVANEYNVAWSRIHEIKSRLEKRIRKVIAA